MTHDLTGTRVALFVPCYVDQLAPRVAFATIEVLRRFGVVPVFPRDQTCCGQPIANMGFADDARPLARSFVRVFDGFEFVVCPSGSCVSMVRNQYGELLGGERPEVCSRTYELCEFLVDVLGVERVGGRFPHRVGLHQSCHALRGLRLGSASELVEERCDPVAGLLATIEGLELVELERVDECCGFGGVFAVEERGVSALMGRDRIRDHAGAGAEVIASVDMSCLLHLDGLIGRDGGARRVMHVAEILASAGGGA